MAKSKPQTQTQKSEPWAPAQPYLKDIMGQAEGLYGSGQGIQPYQGSTVADPSGATYQAQQGILDRARGGNPLLGQAQGAIGGLLNADPYAGSDAVASNIAQKVMPQVNATFSGAGRTGSGLHQDTAVRAMTEAYAPYAQNQYNQDQNRMVTAAGMAPGLANADYGDLNQIGLVGAQRDLLGQRRQDDSVNRYYQEQNAPYDALNRYNSIIQGLAGLGGTQTSTVKGGGPSTFQQIAGAGLGTAGLLMGGPVGGMLGASLGGMGGSALGGGMGLRMGGLY